MLGGATIIDPDHTVIDAGVTLAPDTLIASGQRLHGDTSVGEGSIDRAAHDADRRRRSAPSAEVVHCYATGATIGDGVSVGPFAYLRPGTVLHDGSKAGAFVEIKNSEVGARTKVPHLSYIGDADDRRGHEPRRQHDHRQLRRLRQAPHDDRLARAHRRRHDLRGAGRGRRRRLDRRRLGDHQGRARRRARDRARAPAEHRGLRRARARAARRPTQPTSNADQSAARPELSMSASETSSTAAYHPRGDERRRNAVRVQRAACRSRQAADARFRAERTVCWPRGSPTGSGSALGQVTTKTFANGEVYCRYEESVRGADVFIVQPIFGNPEEGLSTNDALMELLVMVDAAVGGSAHRVIAVMPLVRLLAPGQEVGAARADQRPAGRAHARGGRHRPDPDDGPARRPDPGLLPEAVRPHDRDVHPHPVLRRPRAR